MWGCTLEVYFSPTGVRCSPAEEGREARQSAPSHCFGCLCFRGVVLRGGVLLRVPLKVCAWVLRSSGSRKVVSEGGLGPVVKVFRVPGLREGYLLEKIRVPGGPPLRALLAPHCIPTGFFVGLSIKFILADS